MKERDFSGTAHSRTAASFCKRDGDVLEASVLRYGEHWGAEGARAIAGRIGARRQLSRAAYSAETASTTGLDGQKSPAAWHIGYIQSLEWFTWLADIDAGEYLGEDEGGQPAD